MKGGGDHVFLGQYSVSPPPLYSLQIAYVCGGWGRLTRMPWRGSRVLIVRFSWFMEQLSTGTGLRPEHYYGKHPNVS